MGRTGATLILHVPAHMVQRLMVARTIATVDTTIQLLVQLGAAAVAAVRTVHWTGGIVDCATVLLQKRVVQRREQQRVGFGLIGPSGWHGELVLLLLPSTTAAADATKLMQWGA